ncbi:MAG: ATP-dependent DNA helicase RecG [Proteobacteria bacterium]|nr:ATP-dependent DNA helicase RecG [Pseudomonadota bacterium]
MKDLLLPLSSLRGVGAVLEQTLIKLIGRNKVFALLLHKPTRVEKISLCPRLFEVENDELIIVKAKVESHIKPATNRQPHKVVCYNPTGYLNLIFFKIFPSQISKMKVGSEIAILGHLQRLAGENKITHPQEILPANEIEKLPRLNVIYPLIAGVTQKFLSKKIGEILAKISDDELGEALKILHHFKSGDVEKARRYIASKELLAWQIAVLLAKNNNKNTKHEARITKHEIGSKFLSKLPFKPTAAQLKAIQEIESEIFSSKKMLRLLQGDVGSGKTIVAISACLAAISQKKQTCVIAPTTVLAKQHLAYFRGFLSIRIELLTSATTKKQKEKILFDLASGEIDVLISTHAALEDDIKFKNLGLAVIDEQHRFGVMQRLKLVAKGENVDLLLMSATPIPRSLMMALYGDMDISILGEKPKNRQRIETLVMSAKKINEVHEAMKRAVLRGEKIFWICPAIEENLEMELTSVKKKFAELVEIFSAQEVGLLHGKMTEKEKEKVMVNFSHGALRILVSTTVIEVGIDVPDATIILIENAENFGLSQLHQLRGRVGRSDKKSFCILLYGEKLSANGRRRLEALRQSDDGFFLAEEDLKMRGSGDLLGTKQSGFPDFRIADLGLDCDLLASARKNAEIMLQGQVQDYQDLLRLFDYDDCLKMIASG